MPAEKLVLVFLPDFLLGAAAEPHLLRAPLCGHHQDGGEGRAGPGRDAAPEDVHRQDPDHAALDLLATG